LEEKKTQITSARVFRFLDALFLRLSSLFYSSSVFLGFDFCSILNQTNTVRVSNVSPKATEHDIQDFFSFSGEIEHIELHKDGELSQIAFVTFKDAQALDTALLLSGATVVDQAVTISAAEESDSPAMSHPAVTPSEHAHATELPVSCTSSLCMSTY
jgi:hypothetical protein